MNPFTMVVFIVAIVTLAGVWRTHMLTQARRARSTADDGLIASMQAQIDRLTERVGVLEKLATDEDRRLAREIDALGPRPQPPAY